MFIFFFQGEESNSSANKCMLKVALYAAQLENYERAIQIYEQVPNYDVKLELYLSEFRTDLNRASSYYS